MEINTNEKNAQLIEGMFEAGAHLGYSKSRRHPSVRPVIFGSKNNIEIIDLEKTSDYLLRAKEFVAALAKEGKQILFVGTKNEARKAVHDAADSIDMPYVANGRWIGGTLTNFPEIRKRVARLEELREKKEKGELGMYTKKERLLIDREIEDLEDNFGGIVSMRELPAAMFVVDSGKESIAVSEARSKGVPVISLSSSDCDMSVADLPIPGNDASLKSISFFLNEIVNAYKEGRKSPTT